MFMDVSRQEGGGGEPYGPPCHSCHRIIGPGEGATEIRFEDGDDQRLHTLNGLYHSACAQPILSVKRAFDLLKRPGWR
ncbi:hypothetical protein [Croceicoccus sp. Ery15]|uniref:hypothetical protein n=1 Tax=Croceicoccus sp. Ery15 TaxID=1703338 RepID=UPI001E4C090C|nr:hypothetical protein [Croceicoccus sp. Ery15]